MPYRRNNYDFVVDSTFRPFSFEEMIQPLAIYKGAYDKAEEAYNELSDKDVFQRLNNLPEGSEGRAIYEGYVNDLRKNAEDLSKHGLSMANRRALTNLKRRYQGEIGRLEHIDAIRRAQIDEQHKLSLQDPTRMYSREAALSSFDDYLHNPDLSYKSYSGALLSKQVGDAASAIAKSLTDYGNGKPLDNFTKTWLQKHGFSAADVAFAINNPDDPRSSAVLGTLVDNVIINSGISQWADPATLEQARAYARQGLWNAVGQTQVNTYKNTGAEIAARTAAQKSLLDYKNQQQAQQQQRINHTMLTPRALRSQNDSSSDYDMYHSTEYVRQLDDSYAKEVKRQIMSEPEVLQSLDFNGKDGFKGKNIKKADLEKFTPTRINYSKYGNTITWINDKGDAIRTNAPMAVNERVSSTVQQAMNNASLNAAVLRKGKVPMTDKNGRPIMKDGVLQFSDTPLTDEMARGYYNDWQEEMDIVNSIGSMYVSPSSTDNVKYKPYEFSGGLQDIFSDEDLEEEE